ncbi:MAG: lytic transglycosylase domain-containing protein [Nitrospinae bacterium]|nr:lytic transglycosylase domain-containing protein [Nitrospinota bacterium]
MIKRIFIPLYLIAITVQFALGGIFSANDTMLKEREFDVSLERLEAAQEISGVMHILNVKAVELNSGEKMQLALSIIRQSEDYGHNPFLLLALIEIESGFHLTAVSSQGAMGLMQVRPFVARYLAGEMEIHPLVASRLFDVETNLKVGSFYLKKMTERYGSTRLALEAYNIGPGRLDERLESGEVVVMNFARKVLDAKSRIERLATRETV